MRLYLAVAVLMLAFVAYTEAQEETIEQKLANFGDQMTEMGKKIAEKAKTTFEGIQNSEFATNTRSWAEDLIEKAKVRFSELTQ